MTEQLAQSLWLRYLLAKESVDQRALNCYVVDQLKKAWKASGFPEPVRILDLGAGLGSMLIRLLEWNLLGRCEYVLLDLNHEVLSQAPDYLKQRLAAKGYQVTERPDGFSVQSDALEIHGYLVAQDVYTWLDTTWPPFHLMVAHAFMDLMDVPWLLPRLYQRLVPGGLLYLTLVFDGGTWFLPPLEEVNEQALLQRYHATMDNRTWKEHKAGASQAGRWLLHHLCQMPMDLLAVGPSDWAVWPQAGQYQADEAFFLDYILDTIYQALATDGQVPLHQLDTWYRQRKEHLAQGRLIYLAHQWDVLARRRPSDTV